MITLPQLVEKLEKRLVFPLPGAAAHEPMRAIPAGGLLPRFEHKLPPKAGSVLILLYPEDGSIRFPLTKRQTYIGAHSDQISLPGGKAEAGETIYATALREAQEEIGTKTEEITIIGRLSDFFVIPSNFVVTPVIAYTKVKPLLTPDPYEVARIITADLFELLKADAVKHKEITAAGRFQMNAPHFEVEGEVVWGATAMMLNEFRVLLREVVDT